MPCALCQTASPLRQSHIVPEFLHRPVYDDKHRTLIVGHEPRPKLIQKGVREALLCDDCESRFESHEHYFSKLWYGERPIPSCAAGSIFTLGNLSYERFKLFMLSIVWRAGVSSSAEFRGLTLGPHAERMRLMLLSDDPGAESEYPLLGAIISDPDDGMLWDRVMIAPMSIRVDRHNAARMVFAGVSWTVLTSSHAAPRLSALYLKEDGTLSMPVMTWQEHADMSRLLEVIHDTVVPDLR